MNNVGVSLRVTVGDGSTFHVHVKDADCITLTAIQQGDQGHRDITVTDLSREQALQVYCFLQRALSTGPSCACIPDGVG